MKRQITIRMGAAEWSVEAVSPEAVAYFDLRRMTKEERKAFHQSFMEAWHGTHETAKGRRLARRERTGRGRRGDRRDLRGSRGRGPRPDTREGRQAAHHSGNPDNH